MTPTPLEAYLRTVEDVDPQAARALVLQLLDEGVPLARITSEVLRPAQVEVGRRWEQGEWSVADEHAATAVTEAALDALVRAGAAVSPSSDAVHVAVACAEGEWHALPARLVGALAGSLGVRVTVLGPSVPAEQLGRRLAAGDVDLLALSCTLSTNLIGAARCTAAAHEQGVPVLAGGSGFGATSRRAFAVGADAWSDDPAALLAAPPALAGRSSSIGPDVLLLDGIDPDLLARAHASLQAAAPLHRRLRDDPSSGQAGLRALARSTAAALLTDDPVVLDEQLLRLGRGVDRWPDAVVAVGAHLLADAVEPVSAQGAQLLHAAAERLVSAVGQVAPVTP